jgi:purine-nucleoside phosphorylase
LLINGIDSKRVSPTTEVVESINQAAKEQNYEIKNIAVRSTGNFYRKNSDVLELAKKAQTQAEEMETYALFSNAIATGKKAGAIMTISDEIITGKQLNAEQRQFNVDKMAIIGLEAIIKLKK